MPLNRKQVQESLTRLAELRAKMRKLADQEAAEIAKITRAEKYADAVDTCIQKYRSKLQAVNALVSPLDSEIRKSIAERVKKTVHGEGLMGVYIPPQVHWDHDLLNGMAIAIKRLRQARTIDKYGTCTIRTVTGGKSNGS